MFSSSWVLLSMAVYSLRSEETGPPTEMLPSADLLKTF